MTANLHGIVETIAPATPPGGSVCARQADDGPYPALIAAPLFLAHPLGQGRPE